MSKQFINMALSILLLSTLSFSVYAHPGMHSVSGFAQGFIHPWQGIDHLLVMMAIGLWSVGSDKQNALFLPLVFLVTMLIGSCIHYAGFLINNVELLIALSVLGVGVILLFKQQISMRLTTGLVIIFALSHGYVHAAEFSDEANVLAYIAGLLLATVTLQSIGLSIGLLTPSIQRRIQTGYGWLCSFAGLLLVI